MSEKIRDSRRMKPLALLTNDDGYASPGLRALRQALFDDYECVLVAPARGKSWIGKALSNLGALTVEIKRVDDAQVFVVRDGTPADCANIVPQRLREPPRFSECAPMPYKYGSVFVKCGDAYYNRGRGFLAHAAPPRSDVWTVTAGVVAFTCYAPNLEGFNSTRDKFSRENFFARFYFVWLAVRRSINCLANGKRLLAWCICKRCPARRYIRAT